MTKNDVLVVSIDEFYYCVSIKTFFAAVSDSVSLDRKFQVQGKKAHKTFHYRHRMEMVDKSGYYYFYVTECGEYTARLAVKTGERFLPIVIRDYAACETDVLLDLKKAYDDLRNDQISDIDVDRYKQISLVLEKRGVI